MKIEITDLPAGKTVQRILLDITFSDSGTVQTESTTHFTDNTNVQSSQDTTHKEQSVPDVSKPKGPFIPNELARKRVEIPQEMLDLEL